ncbi:hypothetical protein MIH18_23700 (plasmid) [Marinobacter sp. M3C]|jgi:hypothetical protein|uniref:hypothetical protein n=1 Tax=Marinobacter sp. M3C TaxID=2917715 RepID=UPI00200D8623|nr:hypothetical protein [Marinobacter sp. M3C]MCL1485139.1 hypothetical protein [Marinobacter sp.]UQG62837.1 hypothetical protein MIH18_23700 [Marinobacter sp. M3C]
MNSKKEKRPNHRPREMEGGKRRNVYIDAESWRLAQELGDGNGSEGIRRAIQIASKRPTPA